MRSVGFSGKSSIILIVLLMAMIGVLPGASIMPVVAQNEAVTTAAVSPGQDAVVVDGPLNQRANASIDGVILQVLATGTPVSVISGPVAANGYQWYSVRANSIEGYVAGQFLGAAGSFAVGDTVFVNSNNVNV